MKVRFFKIYSHTDIEGNESADAAAAKAKTGEAREESEGNPSKSDSNEWMLGVNIRNRGSIHCDIWEGTAAQLAQKNVLAIYPVGGWWKEIKKLERWKNKAKYSLVVSIETKKSEVDLYASIEAVIKNSIKIEIS